MGIEKAMQFTPSKFIRLVAVTLFMVAGLFAAPASAATDGPLIKTCKDTPISNTQKVKACASVIWGDADHTGVNGVVDVTAYKWSNPLKKWVRDDSVLVSADIAKLYINAQLTGGVGYPTGPQAGYASSVTRGVSSVYCGDKVFAGGKVGLWKNGQEVKVFDIWSSTATVHS